MPGFSTILDTVMDELSRDPNKTFSYVEMAFFTKWWSEQDDATKMRVKTLVNNKQLEFVNAGWCMNDEATTDYNSIIDQMSLGLRFVNDTFGPQARPRVAWHIDPFGHSAEQAAIFAKMGYDAFFITRIDRSDMAARMNARTLEMVWRGSHSLGAGSEIFTGVLYTNHYGTPEGFCYDLSCKDIPIVDDPTQESYNVPDRVNAFVAAANDQAQHYTTNNILMTFGDDFQYENAHQNFKNIDKLIKYVNQDGRVHAFYSTPSRYIDAVHAANKTWTLKTDDFFPYADRPYAYWTGYFTSRPALKGYVQVCNNILQACKQLEAIRNGVQATSSRSLQQAMAVVQHHDGVSGTEQQHVANDYAKQLHVHRRLLCDDWRGVDQPLNETGATGRGLVITGRHMAVLDTIGNSPSLHRLLAKTIMLPPIYAFTPSSQSYSDYGKYYNPTYAGLAQSLPPQVHLLTLQLISPKTLLLRLEHQYQLDEPPYNKSVTISLSNMFTGFSVVSATELVLGANENIDNVQRLKWNVNGDNCGRARYQGHVKKPLHACQPQQHSRRINAKSSHLPIRGPRFTVQLEPMEIHTFEVQVEYLST
eukprot:Em0002g1795a